MPSLQGVVLLGPASGLPVEPVSGCHVRQRHRRGIERDVLLKPHGFVLVVLGPRQ
ncbi:MAG TPA: hypothetical protein PKL24_10995 [Polyangiaceae bacterium]|nr:hypothetical protein [Polyangiaceae bacterium]HOD21558.1 hypothetical protein [Polyangiaceae bacterium]HOR38070.1 hypothetical protein [Polyangiaceae bacterium]HPK94753.1 hypothetical protein [Polyangiaceae bacterium]HQB46436.1 hypothetical protein [Polyangiaceae bacterium]